jgi:hypothetical protein
MLQGLLDTLQREADLTKEQATNTALKEKVQEEEARSRSVHRLAEETAVAEKVLENDKRLGLLQVKGAEEVAKQAPACR